MMKEKRIKELYWSGAVFAIIHNIKVFTTKIENNIELDDETIDNELTIMLLVGLNEVDDLKDDATKNDN